jgi:hypothetical protein
VSERWPAFNPAEILGSLVARGVDFVVIGGLAAVFHGSARITQDLDITYSPEPANLEMLGGALLDMNARLFGIEEDVPFAPDARSLASTEILTLATDLGKLDVLRSPSGAPRYPELRDAAVLVPLEAFAVRVASPAHLIAMKRATGRPKDLADVAELEEIQALRAKGT